MMADLKKVFAPKEKSMGVTMVPVMLGSMVLKFTLPMQIIDKINKSYDKRLSELPAHNTELAGKIAEEKLVDDLMTDDMKGLFVGCFQQYLKSIQKPLWAVSLNTAWINEMRANEYNPFHYHTSKITDLGLSSVLVLKTPDTYGEEFSNPDDPSNGYLEFTGGNQDPLGVSQFRTNAQVGEFYVFPYTMLHGVYPFNGTDQTRRTLSYNCDLIKPTEDNV
tara:strand:- start:123 stop:782 length:660 start_codon:yes stop_codon:yes gene_type:complete